MGYQESFITCKDFDWLVDRVRQMGELHYEYEGVSVVEIVTLDRDLKFNLEYMCHPERKVKFPKGTKFIWVCGERYPQKCPYGEDKLLGEIQPDDKPVEIYFIECMSDQLFDKDNWLFTHEPFEFV